MDFVRTFRFRDDSLNRRLIGLLKKNEIRHAVDATGVIHYAIADEESVENDLIGAIRARVFPSWQVLSCPEDWADRYRDYMRQNAIPFTEEEDDGQSFFLLPRKYRPHLWKMEAVSSARAVDIGR
jgi:hypothetical protein